MFGSWSPPTWLLVVSVLVWATAQYGLAYWTLRDLIQRPRVRSDNKVLWALIILTVPVAGAVIYATIGPTSFLPRRPGGTTVSAPPRRRPAPPRRRGDDR